MEVSENGATPKSSNLINRIFPYKPSSYWVSPWLWNPPGLSTVGISWGMGSVGISWRFWTPTSASATNGKTAVSIEDMSAVLRHLRLRPRNAESSLTSSMAQPPRRDCKSQKKKHLLTHSVIWVARNWSEFELHEIDCKNWHVRKQVTRSNTWSTQLICIHILSRVIIRFQAWPLYYHPHKRWWANACKEWIAEADRGASTDIQGYAFWKLSLKSFWTQWASSEPVILPTFRSTLWVGPNILHHRPNKLYNIGPAWPNIQHRPNISPTWVQHT